MNDKFQNTAIIMIGCEGLNNTKTAEALIKRGAKVYIGWNGDVSASHRNKATTQLLTHLTQNQTVR
jgi:hypothetical protein